MGGTISELINIPRNVPQFARPAIRAIRPHVRYRLPYIALEKSLLHTDAFGEALSTYFHELAHMFGGHRSVSFSHALSKLMEITLSNAGLIAEWEKNIVVRESLKKRNVLPLEVYIPRPALSATQFIFEIDFNLGHFRI